MQRRASFLLLSWLLFASVLAAAADGPADTNPPGLLAPFNARMRKTVLVDFKPLTLTSGVPVQTAVFRQTEWDLKEYPQSATLGMKMEQEALALPESRRIEVMNRFDDDTQVWVASLKDARANARFKVQLMPAAAAHRYHREVAFLGRGHGWAWFGYMPIYEWILLQRELNLEGGDDPLGAAARGLAVEDSGSMTANSAEAMLVQAGTNALPYLKPLLTAGSTLDRALRTLAQIPGVEATILLIRSAESTDHDVASRARRLLAGYPRAEAEDMYFQQLSADAGRVRVDLLLSACEKVNKARLAKHLPKVMASPKSVREYRHAFELSRSIRGKKIGDELLAAEEAIKTCGYGSGTNFSQSGVDAAAKTLIESKDVDAAACLALSLAVATTKGDWRAANKAGVTVLKALPKSRGQELARTVRASTDDESEKRRLDEVFATVR